MILELMILELKQSKFRDQHGVRVGYVFTGGEFASVQTNDRDGVGELSQALEWCGANEGVRHPADWGSRELGVRQAGLLLSYAGELPAAAPAEWWLL